MRELRRRRGLRPEGLAEQEITVPPAPVNGLLAGLFGSELMWLKHAPLPIGVSIVVIARRPA